MAEFEVSILALCLPLWSSAYNMLASLIPDEKTADVLYLYALLFYLLIPVSAYLDRLRQRFHRQRIQRENLFYRVLINPYSWVVPDSGAFFIFILAFFTPHTFPRLNLKIFWIFVYFAFSSLLYIYGLFESNNWLK
ncbi:hypothetical protein GCK72_016952 [Caenorhabditis remanei]|uniref:Uncharacterized protein n=1 Tax=Caenorhabditis remanei TaxID=31234 RepID=A0A6A5G6T0_CAERE|nr:hypothetical protein GCK72_016952 [Caenorhabditis remanei]KAF1750402.1 hypothetical protein GCK72_016952 [Caenorhabditis remanei]